LNGLTLDLADARIVRALLAGVDGARRTDIQAALATKDVSALRGLCAGLEPAQREAVLALPGLYGRGEVIARARELLPPTPLMSAALDDLATLARHAQQAHPEVKVGFDLADAGGSSYYSGARFAIYVSGSSDAIARGGRYDEVGAIFGRNRPAVGFSLDLKELAEQVPGRGSRPAVRAPWSEDAALRSAVRRLREQGETVVCILPGHEHEGQEFECDRELVAIGDQWAVRAL
jgi:ATP phosphoribosyltransferase regulatory subunit